mgnify:CR=1 FL=1
MKVKIFYKYDKKKFSNILSSFDFLLKMIFEVMNKVMNNLKNLCNSMVIQSANGYVIPLIEGFGFHFSMLVLNNAKYLKKFTDVLKIKKFKLYI